MELHGSGLHSNRRKVRGAGAAAGAGWRSLRHTCRLRNIFYIVDSQRREGTQTDADTIEMRRDLTFEIAHSDVVRAGQHPDDLTIIANDPGHDSCPLPDGEIRAQSSPHPSERAETTGRHLLDAHRQVRPTPGHRPRFVESQLRPDERALEERRGGVVAHSMVGDRCSHRVKRAVRPDCKGSRDDLDRARRDRPGPGRRARCRCYVRPRSQHELVSGSDRVLQIEPGVTQHVPPSGRIDRVERRDSTCDREGAARYGTRRLPPRHRPLLRPAVQIGKPSTKPEVAGHEVQSIDAGKK